ncbi:MAG: dihydrofolate reductase family protein [Alphaproteobacteria bacterium]|nr:dihydrofolate reductase family protein [Alphaproteobacteria bacterium]MCB9695745.1 dihydrofolate reductase family protein [Alphaproteobacteria bacterium]
MGTGRVRVYLGCSLDGCIAGPEHDLSFLHEQTPEPDPSVPDAGLGFEAFMEQVGALLMGRRTYQVPLDYDAWFYGERPVLVATHHPLPPAPKGGIARAVQGPIEELVAQALDAAGGKDVYLDGGDIVRQALDAGLVDEICLSFLPLVLGRGIRLWEGLQRRNDLVFEPPVTHGARMIQITARVVR